MSVREVGRLTILFISATILLMTCLFYVAGGSSIPIDTLPTRLSDKEFWRMVTDFSESGGFFRSDNFLSNESGYQRVIPSLKKIVEPGGVYVGVGPEQNFTYIVGSKPKLAFVVDIRRQNMLEHLVYKALMEMSSDRAEFLSRLFSRPKPPSLSASTRAEALFNAYDKVRASETLFEANARLVLEYLKEEKGFDLSVEDETAIRKVYAAFFDSGPDLRYSFFGGYGIFMGMPTYADLMTETDGILHNWSFLASEEQYRVVHRLQKNNLIVPLVGDFAGPKALRSVGEYLKEHDALVTVFYTSNVEQYLFQDDNNWRSFYENVGTLPLDSSSTFIRYVVNRGFNRAHTVLSPMAEVVEAYKSGDVRSYYDVIDMSR
jgi:hypothetical protein